MTKVKNKTEKNENVTEILDLMDKMVYISEGNAENIVLLIAAFDGLKQLLNVLFEYVKKVHPRSEIAHITVNEYCARYMKKTCKNFGEKESLRMFLSELTDIISEQDETNN